MMYVQEERLTLCGTYGMAMAAADSSWQEDLSNCQQFVWQRQDCLSGASRDVFLTVFKMDSSQWSVTRNRRRRRCPGACGGAGASGKPGFKHLCNRCEMWMCPSCKTDHICFEPPALPEPDEEPPALPDFGVDDSILLAPSWSSNLQG